MLILAIEQSTPAASLALLRDGSLLAHEEWHEARKRDQHLFATLPRLLDEAGTPVEALDRIAVGLGPGSFSGVRIAIAAACALALPDRRPVAGIGSAEVLAGRIMRTTGAQHVAIVGDARRERLWLAGFERAPDGRGPQPSAPLSLLPAKELPDRLPTACHVVSPDWERLAPLLTPLSGRGYTLTTQAAYPAAIDMAHLAARIPSEALSTPLQPPQPLYLHPAVFVAPRFPANPDTP